METAKRLFGKNGFNSTSVADIARAADLPVGSIYTYFDSKEDLIRAIVDDGWSDLRERLQLSLSDVEGAERKFELILDTFLPELLGDVDFISILLSEGVEYTRIEEKAQELSEIIGDIIEPIANQASSLRNFSEKDMEAALLVYFTGVMGAVRISQTANLPVTSADVLAFLRRTIRNGLGVSA